MNIPSGWKEVILRDLCESYRYGYTAKAQAEPVGPKLLRITDIVPDLVDWSSVPHCEIDSDKVAKYRLKEGDIVIARTGATTGYAKRIKRNPDAVFASYLVRLRISEEHDNQYIGCVVESDTYKQFIKTNLSGAAQPNANAQVLTSFLVLLPPLPIQRKIAAILSAYDDLIENNTRRIGLLEHTAQILYREWFVHFRFPGHESVSLVESELGPIPEGWEFKNLYDIADVTTGFAFKSRRFTSESIGMPVIRIRDILNNSTKTFTEQKADEKYLVENGDILIGMDGDFHMRNWAGGKAYLNQRVARVRPKGNLPSYYLFWALEGPIHYFNSTIVGTTVAHLGKKHLVTINILIPDEYMIQQVKQTFQPLLDLQLCLLLRNANLRATRDLLLPRLISGQLDVSELDIAIGEINQ